MMGIAKRKKPQPKVKPQDETVRLLEDINLTLNEILEVLKEGMEPEKKEGMEPEKTEPPKDFSRENA